MQGSKNTYRKSERVNPPWYEVIFEEDLSQEWMKSERINPPISSYFQIWYPVLPRMMLFA